ncbi:MAG: multidrug efflux protein [Coxiella sp. RIFCSPHIGHO2_12_FULL_44_14]|nr:MAG: multidrug efflux protein [Coxiella sp. RIFCSPHIGHO2_12_FULL_44_14]
MRFTDLCIKRPVLAIVISALILVFGLRSMNLLPIQQYPSVQTAVVQIGTTFMGADPETIAAFITTPLENAVSQVNGIDYMTSSSAQNNSNILANLILNYDPDKALTEIAAQATTVQNQLPEGAQIPQITITVGESIASMYIGFYSNVLPSYRINDYVLRVVQPQLQAVSGVQEASILGNFQIALRAWLDPKKLAGYGISANEVAQKLKNNDFVAGIGRTDGQSFILNLTTTTALNEVEQFKNLIIKAKNNTIIRLKDVATVTLGSQNYNTNVTFDDKAAVYLSIIVAPNANLLTVLDNIKKVFHQIQEKLPTGLKGNIVYDSSLFVDSSINEVIKSLFEAFIIVTVVVFLFLSSFRSLMIPVIAIPLSIIGTFFIMYTLNYSFNLLTLLALVLAIGLVVDDAIIVVENVHRHIEEGIPPFKAAILSARELIKPIIAISVVLIAVYVPIGFMGGLTGSLFTEFAFTLAGAVGVSAIIALTLSPMMCSRFLKSHDPTQKRPFTDFIEGNFKRFTDSYHHRLQHALNYLSVVIVFAIIILLSNYFLFVTSQSELAPQEDMGIIMNQTATAGNSSLYETAINSQAIDKIYDSYPETMHTFQINGTSGATNAPTLNSAIGGMVLTPWNERKLTSNQLQPQVQKKAMSIAGASIAMFQPPPLPNGGSGLPIQFVIQTTDPFNVLDGVTQQMLQAAKNTGLFLYITTDLKYDQAQTTVVLNRDKISELGLDMKDVGATLNAALSQNYLNYFNYMGRSYQVIPQTIRPSRLNANQLLNYYLQTNAGQPISLASVAHIKQTVVPEAVNHFQQLNSATISAVAMPTVSMGEALKTLKNIAAKILPANYFVNYGSQSRQFMQEGSALIGTFGFALIIIFLSLSVLFNSFRDPLIVLISVPMSICGAMIFISLSVGGATLNIYTEVGLITLIGLISKHGILIVQFANDQQLEGKSKREAIELAARIRFRPILMTTAAMVLGVIPLIMASGAGAESRFDIGLVIATGIAIGTLFTLFVVPAMYLLIADDYQKKGSVAKTGQWD